MNMHFKPRARATNPAGSARRFDCIALLLQGGGALGAYQGGVYEALAEADLQPDWVAGISIGAINAALIAGNPPETRVVKLRGFWEEITADPVGFWSPPADLGGDLARSLGEPLVGNGAALFGAPAFFSPRLAPPAVATGRDGRAQRASTIHQP